MLLNEPLHYDEAFTFLNFSSQSIVNVLSNFSVPNNQILHSLLVYISYNILGNTEWAIRMPAFIAGVLVVYAGYRVASRLFGHHSGFICAVLCAWSQSLLLYSVDARGYSLYVLLFLILIWLAMDIIEEDRPESWIKLSCIAALGAWTIPSFSYCLVSVFCWIFYVRLVYDKKLFDVTVKIAAAGLMASFFVFILYSPVLVRFSIDSLIEHHNAVAFDRIKPMDWSVFLETNMNELSRMWSSWHRNFFKGSVLLFPLLCMVAVTAKNNFPFYKISLLPLLILGVVIFLLLQRNAPFARTWLFLQPVYFAYVAAGAVILMAHFKSSVNVTSMTAFVGFILIASSMYLSSSTVDDHYGSNHPFYDAREVSMNLATILKAGDQIAVMDPPRPTMEYYLSRSGVRLSEYLHRPGNNELDGNIYIATTSWMGESLESVIDQFRIPKYHSHELIHESNYSRIYKLTKN